VERLAGDGQEDEISRADRRRKVGCKRQPEARGCGARPL
jgi:hypothetical protein